MTSEGHYAGTQPAEATSGGPTSDGFPPDTDGRRIAGRASAPPPADGFPSSYAPPPPATPNGGSPFVVPAVRTFGSGSDSAGAAPSGTPAGTSYGSARVAPPEENGALPQRGAASPYGSVSPGTGASPYGPVSPNPAPAESASPSFGSSSAAATFGSSSAAAAFGSSYVPPSGNAPEPPRSAWAPKTAPPDPDGGNPFPLPQRTPAPVDPATIGEFDGFAAGTPGRGTLADQPPAAPSASSASAGGSPFGQSLGARGPFEPAPADPTPLGRPLAANAPLGPPPSGQPALGQPLSPQSPLGPPPGQSSFGPPAGESPFGAPAGQSPFGSAAGQSPAGDVDPSTGRPPGVSAFGAQRVRVPGATLNGLPDAPQPPRRPGDSDGFPTRPSDDPGRLDGGRLDAVAPDAGRFDGGRLENGISDSGRPDLSRFDAGGLDNGRPDLSRPDSGRPDVGSGFPLRGSSDGGSAFPLRGSSGAARRGESGGFPLRGATEAKPDPAQPPASLGDLPVRSQHAPFNSLSDGTAFSAFGGAPAPAPASASADQPGQPYGQPAGDSLADPFGRRPGADGRPVLPAAPDPARGGLPDPFGRTPGDPPAPAFGEPPAPSSFGAAAAFGEPPAPAFGEPPAPSSFGAAAAFNGSGRPDGEASPYGARQSSDNAGTYGSAKPADDASPYGSPPPFTTPRTPSTPFGNAGEAPTYGSTAPGKPDAPVYGSARPGSTSYGSPTPPDNGGDAAPYGSSPYGNSDAAPYGSAPFGNSDAAPYGSTPPNPAGSFGTGDSTPYGSSPPVPFGDSSSPYSDGNRPGSGSPYGGNNPAALGTGDPSPFGDNGSDSGPYGSASPFDTPKPDGDSRFGSPAASSFGDDQPADDHSLYRRPDSDNGYPQRVPGANLGALGTPAESRDGSVPAPRDPSEPPAPAVGSARPVTASASVPSASRVAPVDPAELPPPAPAPQARVYGRPAASEPEDDPADDPEPIADDVRPGSGSYGSPAGFGTPPYPQRTGDHNGPGSEPGVAPQSPARAAASARVTPALPLALPAPDQPRGPSFADLTAPGQGPNQSGPGHYAHPDQYSELTTDIAGRSPDQAFGAPFGQPGGTQPFPAMNGSQPDAFGGGAYGGGLTSRATVTPPSPDDTTNWPGPEQGKFDQFKPEAGAPAAKPEAPHVRMLPILISVVIGAVLLLGLVFGIVYLVAGGGKSETFTVNTGECVKRDGDAAVKADCGDASSFQVISIVDDKSKCGDPQQPYVVNSTGDGKNQVLCLKPKS